MSEYCHICGRAFARLYKWDGKPICLECMPISKRNSTPELLICHRCQRMISKDETPHVHGGNIVCEQCDNGLKSYGNVISYERRHPEQRPEIRNDEPKRKSGITITGSGILILLILGLVGWGWMKSYFAQQAVVNTLPRSSSGSVNISAAPIVDADELIDDYERNGVAADQKWKGQLIGVRGIIHSIDVNPFDPKVGAMHIGGKHYLNDVRYNFRISGNESQFRKGEAVVMYGVCDGKMIFVQVNAVGGL
jgi:hypothetical protein